MLDFLIKGNRKKKQIHKKKKQAKQADRGIKMHEDRHSAATAWAMCSVLKDVD